MSADAPARDVGWAITTLARRSRATWRFRLFMLLLPFATAGIAVAATELRMEELWWLVGVVGLVSAVGGIAALQGGPSGEDVRSAYAILERELAKVDQP